MELLPAAATLDQRARRPVGGALDAVGSSRAEGKWAASRVPRPEALWRLNRPPCSSNRERTRGRPRPVPSKRRFHSPSPCTKGSKDRKSTTSELQSLIRISYDVLSLQNKKRSKPHN